MTLEEVRQQIDTLDPQIRDLIMKRMDCSYHVAQVKAAAGETQIFRADREEAILKRLGEDVPEERAAGYLAVVRKIMEASRMYQYGLLYDWMPGVLDPWLEGLAIREGGTSVTVEVTRPDRPNAMSAILSMIGDYGYNMKRMEMVGERAEGTASHIAGDAALAPGGVSGAAAGTVTFRLEILGDLSTEHMKKLMFQLSGECESFRILAQN